MPSSYKKGGSNLNVKEVPVKATLESKGKDKIKIFFGIIYLIIKFPLKFYIIVFILSYVKKFLYALYIELCKAWQFLKSFFKTLANPGRWEIPIFGWKIPNFWAWITATLDLIMFGCHLLVAMGYFIALCIAVLPINFVLKI